MLARIHLGLQNNLVVNNRWHQVVLKQSCGCKPVKYKKVDTFTSSKKINKQNKRSKDKLWHLGERQIRTTCLCLGSNHL